MTRFLPLLLLFAACQAPDVEEAAATTDAATSEVAEAPADIVLVGEAMPDGATMTPSVLLSQSAALDGEAVLVEGRVEKVCQMAGCWITLVADDGQTVRVNVPRDAEENYVFTFPDDVSGQTARVAGTVTVEEESVEILRHYAEDEGASPDEVAAITEPRRTVAVEATGAVITRNDA